MLIKYRKETQKNKKILIYVIIAILCVVFNLFDLIATYPISKNVDTTLQLIAPVASFAISCLSVLYCIIQDIIRSYREEQSQFIFRKLQVQVGHPHGKN